MSLTVLNNLKYPNLGSVKITFNDDSYVIKTVDALGYTIFSNDDRIPTSMYALGNTYNAGDGPTPVTYPDSSTGFEFQKEIEITGAASTIYLWQEDCY